ILSGLVLIAWQYFYNIPQMEKQRAQQQVQAELQKQSAPAQQQAGGASPSTAPQAGGQAPQAGAAPASVPVAANAPTGQRNTALAADPRVKVETPSVVGSIRLKGARIDDLSLVKFRETVDPNSPPIVLYAPSGTAEPYYAEFGWVPAAGSTVRLPDQNTMWQ